MHRVCVLQLGFMDLTEATHGSWMDWELAPMTGMGNDTEATMDLINFLAPEVEAGTGSVFSAVSCVTRWR